MTPWRNGRVIGVEPGGARTPRNCGVRRLRKEKKGIFEKEGILMVLLFLGMMVLGFVAAMIVPYVLRP